MIFQFGLELRLELITFPYWMTPSWKQREADELTQGDHSTVTCFPSFSLSYFLLKKLGVFLFFFNYHFKKLCNFEGYFSFIVIKNMHDFTVFNRVVNKGKVTVASLFSI